jgi:HEAT repeat protein
MTRMKLLPAAIVLGVIAGESFVLAQGMPPRTQIPVGPPEVRAEIEGLYSTDPVTRGRAAAALRKRPSASQAAVPFLAALLGDGAMLSILHSSSTTSVGEQAAVTLSEFGKAGLAALEQGFRSADEQTRASSAVGLVYSPDRAAVKRARSGLTDLSPVVRANVLDALGSRKFTVSIEMLQTLLADPAAQVRRAVVDYVGMESVDMWNALGWQRPGVRARFAALIAPALTDKDVYVRREGVRALRVIGDKAPCNQIARLAKLDPDVGVRGAAADARDRLCKPD